MIPKIIGDIGGVPRHMSTNYGYEGVAKDFEVVRLSGEDRIG